MKKLIPILLTLITSACATMPYQPYAREVKKTPNSGGVIAMKSEYRPEDRQRAEFLMSSNCGSNAIVKVLEEGEMVVGEKTNSNSKKAQETEAANGFSIGSLTFGSLDPSAVEKTNMTTETVKLKEWQISYGCVAMKAPDTVSSKKNLSRK